MRAADALAAGHAQKRRRQDRKRIAVEVAQHSLMEELESARQSGSADKRLETLRRVTDLFLYETDRLNDDQIGVFDQVLGHLIQKIESRALIELSHRLAPIDNAPIETIRGLAWSDDILIAKPVLETSARLGAHDLEALARVKGQAHLLAISGRPTLGEGVTDILISRGDMAVFHRLAANAGAVISQSGFEALVKAAEKDDELALKTGSRIDLPLRLLRELISKAAEAVRNRLFSLLTAVTQSEIQQTLSSVVREVGHEATQQRDYSTALQFVRYLEERGELDESKLLQFALDGQYEETVAALSLLSSMPIAIIKPLMQSGRCDGLLIPCRAVGLGWETVIAIVRIRFRSVPISQPDLDVIGREYAKLSRKNAERTLRFWKVRNGGKS